MTTVLNRNGRARASNLLDMRHKWNRLDRLAINDAGNSIGFCEVSATSGSSGTAEDRIPFHIFIGRGSRERGLSIISTRECGSC